MKFVLKASLEKVEMRIFYISAFGRIFSVPCLSSTFVISSWCGLKYSSKSITWTGGKIRNETDPETLEMLLFNQVTRLF